MIAPCDIRSERDALQLRETVWNGRGHWMLVQHDGRVHIQEQRMGEPSTAQIEIPRRTFLAMVEWYMRQQGEAT